MVRHGFFRVRESGNAGGGGAFFPHQQPARAMTERKPDHAAGLSSPEQETALVAIGQAMEGLTAHGDAHSQWRLHQIERAIAALDRGEHEAALRRVERASIPAEELSAAERHESAKLGRRLEADQLRAALDARRPRHTRS